MNEREGRLSVLEYHVLLALAAEPQYGYAIAASVEQESDGTLTPRAGTLYRVVARLITWGLVREAEPPDGEEVHPGRARRWYALTAEGREALAEESGRLLQVATLARQRLRPGRP